MIRSEKIELVGDLAEKLKQAQSVILADFRGLTVAQVTELRGKLRQSDVEFRVIKNRLGKRAVSEAGCENIDDFLAGNTAWAFGIADPVSGPKILSKFAEDHEHLVLKGGLLEGKRIDEATVKQLASMPSRPELLSMMAGGLMMPAVQMASAMQAAVAKVARAFHALGEKLEGEGAA